MLKLDQIYRLPEVNSTSRRKERDIMDYVLRGKKTRNIKVILFVMVGETKQNKNVLQPFEEFR